MKYHTSLLATTVGFAGLRLTTSTTPVDACDAAIVQQAADDGFLEYVMLNCMTSSLAGALAPLNFLGETPVKPAKCLIDWVADHPDPNPIPAIGDCRAAFQNFVTALSVFGTGDWFDGVDEFGGTLCSYDPENEKLTVPVDCLLANVVRTALNNFRIQSGSYVGGSHQCPAVTVRKLSQKGIYATLMKRAIDSLGNPMLQRMGIAVPGSDGDGGNALCYKCYSDFYMSLNDVAPDGQTYDELVTLCAEWVVNSATCLAATPVAQALADFKECSGGFDMMFTGPVCSATDVDEVQKLIPAPYFAFTHCAYNPTDSFCVTLDAYVDKIREESDSSCVLCYIDYRVAVQDDATDVAKIAACTGTDGVYNAACKASSGTSLSNFYACSGYQLNTVKPDTAPIPVMPVPAADTTAEETTTTAAPVVETTKTATVAMTSGLVLVATIAALL
jgi:hypothetical protein